MNAKRHLPLLMLPLLMLAACSKNETPASPTPVASPATSDSAAPAGEAAAAGEAPASTTQAPALDHSALVPDVDYVEIAGGQPFQPLDGKVEVVEVFAYWCNHCAALEPVLKSWKAKQPADVRFTALPLGGGAADTLARVYFAAETTGQLDKVHDLMFNAIHHQRSLPANANADEILAFLGKNGVDAQSMRAAMNSFAMSARLGQVMQFADRTGVEGTPTLIVNGKYRVLRGMDAGLRVVDALVARERALAAP
ncbi:thiol:disulfide interchange protein DsbA/DsbL [Luteimonas sp. e5]